MSSFSPDDVQGLARLARLELQADEIPTFTRQLNEVLAFVRQVQSVDTTSVEELTGDHAMPLREDVPAASLTREEALAGAADADHAASLFTVPRVLGG